MFSWNHLHEPWLQYFFSFFKMVLKVFIKSGSMKNS